MEIPSIEGIGSILQSFYIGSESLMKGFRSLYKKTEA